MGRESLGGWEAAPGCDRHECEMRAFCHDSGGDSAGTVWSGWARAWLAAMDRLAVGLGKGYEISMLNERSRRPGKVILLVVAFWVSGTVLQGALRSVAEQAGVTDVDVATRIGQVTAWGLLFVLSVIYRRPIDVWLRR